MSKCICIHPVGAHDDDASKYFHLPCKEYTGTVDIDGVPTEITRRTLPRNADPKDWVKTDMKDEDVSSLETQILSHLFNAKPVYTTDDEGSREQIGTCKHKDLTWESHVLEGHCS